MNNGRNRCRNRLKFPSHAIEVITRLSMVGGGSISGSLCTRGRPSATSVKTLLIVSSVRCAVICSLRTARIAVDAKRKRFSIRSPAAWTSSDRILPHFRVIDRFGTEVRLELLHLRVISKSKVRHSDRVQKLTRMAKNGTWQTHVLYCEHTLFRTYPNWGSIVILSRN
jgi:hypothetical protein